jgi:hypothetical protein
MGSKSKTGTYLKSLAQAPKVRITFPDVAGMGDIYRGKTVTVTLMGGHIPMFGNEKLTGNAKRYVEGVCGIH